MTISRRITTTPTSTIRYVQAEEIPCCGRTVSYWLETIDYILNNDKVIDYKMNDEKKTNQQQEDVKITETFKGMRPSRPLGTRLICFLLVKTIPQAAEHFLSSIPSTSTTTEDSKYKWTMTCTIAVLRSYTRLDIRCWGSTTPCVLEQQSSTELSKVTRLDNRIRTFVVQLYWKPSAKW